MKNIFLPLFLVFSFWTCLSYALEPQAGWGVTVKEGEKELKIGGRLQGIGEHSSDSKDQNLYLRRVRVNLAYRPWKGHKFIFDVRNDKSNAGHNDDGAFQIGDAYWKIDSNSSYVDNFKFFRAKVDVSYSQTSSSKNLFSPDRTLPAEVAASFVVSGRRASNAQANGHIGKTYYQLVMSEGIGQEDVEVLSGSGRVNDISSQSLVLGGKVRYYFMGSPQENIVQDTFYGQYDAFSLGLGHFSLDRIELGIDGSEKKLITSRKLTNLEASFSNGPLRFLGEAFYFEGMLGDLGNNTGVHGQGSYAQVEYVVSKLAPYLGHETMDYWSSREGFEAQGTYFGLNYYEKKEAKRYGLRVKESRFGKNIGDRNETQFQVYVMLNF